MTAAQNRARVAIAAAGPTPLNGHHVQPFICINGHPQDDEHSRVVGGKRRCVTCERKRRNDRYRVSGR